MDKKKELYYYIEAIRPKKGGGYKKVVIDFNSSFMSYEEVDVTGKIICSIYINHYDYNLAVDVLLEAYNYKPDWIEAIFP